MIKTKYGGEVTENGIVDYFKMLTNDIYKCLCMFEEQEGTLSIYIETLLIELNSSRRIILMEDKDFIKLITNLEPLLSIEDHEPYKRQVFKCLNICKKLIEKYLKGV